MTDDYSDLYEKIQELENDNRMFEEQIKQLIVTVGILSERVRVLSINAGIPPLDMEPIE